VSGFGMIERPSIPALEAKAVAKPETTRAVYFNQAFVETAIYERAALGPGGRIDGPAIIEEFGSTTVVFPGQFLDVDAHGILIIRPIEGRK